MLLLTYELRLLCRQILRTPMSSGLVLLVLYASFFSLIASTSLYYSLCVQPPDFDRGNRLAVVDMVFGGANQVARATPNELRALYRERGGLFQDIGAAALYRTIFIGTDDTTERVLGANLSSDVLRMVGAKPLLGRLFTPSDDAAGAAPSVLLSYAIWQGRFRGDPDVVGRPLRVDGELATIIGVMPSDFRFPNDQQIWLPMGFNKGWRNPNSAFIDIVVQLRPQQRLDTATRDLQLLMKRLRPEVDPARSALVPVLRSFRDVYLPIRAKSSATLLLALAVSFLLIGCLNAANLLTMQFVDRANETGMMLALGLSTRAVLRLFAFRVILYLSAALLAAAVTVRIVSPLIYAIFSETGMPFWMKFTIEWHTLIVVAAFGVIAIALALVAPTIAIFSGRLTASARGGIRGSGRTPWSNALLFLQVVILATIGVCTATLVKSSFNLDQVRLGFVPDGVLSTRFGLRTEDFPTLAKRQAVIDRITTETASLPGIEGAALVSEVPGTTDRATLFVADSAGGFSNERFTSVAHRLVVNPTFFSVLKIPLLAGEPFSPADTADRPPCAIINNSLATRLWGNTSPIGRSIFVRVGSEGTKEPSELIVKGVVADLCAGGLLDEQRDVVFIPATQTDQLFFYLLARGANSTVPVFEPIRAAVARVSARIPLYFPKSAASFVAASASTVHLTTNITCWFAVLAAIVGGGGIYSTTTSRVLQQRRELAIRLALGGQPQLIWVRFIRRYLWLCLSGIAIGLPVGALIVSYFKYLLFQTGPLDAVIYLATIAVFVGFTSIALAPSFLVVRKTDPARILRESIM